jgi:hypothetical protein
MQHEPQPNVVRIAHIFEMMTSRQVADAYTSARPGVQLVERQLTSLGQLLALLNNLLDVAILRVTAQMLADHPTGWHHRLLRLEPIQLVGRPGDPARATASLRERPIEVFADAPGSGLYNAHGQYMTAFERHTGGRHRDHLPACSTHLAAVNPRLPSRCRGLSHVRGSAGRAGSRA